MSGAPIRVGLISDTHGMLRPQALQRIRDCNHIVHAGDVCEQAILDALAAVAPYTAVRGNNDRGSWADKLPGVATLDIGAVRILVVHDLDTLAIDLHAAGVHVVVSGHSHCPATDTRDGILFVNPGSAGPRRFRLPISVGELVISGREVRAALTELHVG